MTTPVWPSPSGAPDAVRALSGAVIRVSRLFEGAYRQGPLGSGMGPQTRSTQGRRAQASGVRSISLLHDQVYWGAYRRASSVDRATEVGLAFVDTCRPV